LLNGGLILWNVREIVLIVYLMIVFLMVLMILVFLKLLISISMNHVILLKRKAVFLITMLNIERSVLPIKKSVITRSVKSCNVISVNIIIKIESGC